MKCEKIFYSCLLLLSLVSDALLTLISDQDASNVIQRRQSRAVIEKDPRKGLTIYEDDKCAILQSYCPHLAPDENLSLLECVNALQPSKASSLPSKCQHHIWQYTRHLTSVKSLYQELTAAQCAQQHDLFIACERDSDMWQCLLRRVTTDVKMPDKCAKTIKRISALFADFESSMDFFEACDADIERLACGRLNLEHRKNSQPETMGCLQKTGGEALNAVCKSVIDKTLHQLADDEFYKICSLELERLCPEQKSGTNSAYKCLVKQRTSPLVSKRCAKQIMQRDKEIARDYRASHSLAKACKDDIKLHHCRRGVSDDKQVRLAQILLCLESVMKNGTNINQDCRLEIDDHRRMLMVDFQMSPETLSDCSEDIQKFCADKASEMGGEVIHCLMDHARLKRRKDHKHVTPQCQRALEDLVKLTDVGEDWRVDPVLRQACKPVVDVACSETIGGDARVMSCLMEHIGTPDMLAECEQALLLIQYFIARDFKLDPQLYKHCRDDAIKYCHAKRSWADANEAQMDPERGPLILPCLHRMAYQDDEKATLRSDCFKEIKRVMRQRAISVDLIPEVEDVCIEDLSVFCYDKTERGTEMACLQDNLEKLQPLCKEGVSTYTEQEAAHVELNPIIMSVCVEAMKAHCGHIIKGEKGDMMDCLISHKNDADLRQDLKCRAAIEHFQIISLKNYHFTYKFKEACRPYVARFCTASATKNEVIACLSEVMRNDTIRGQRHSIPKECRQQVKAQLYQQRESVALDPKLANACKKELEQLCANEKGPGQSVDCLIRNTPRLGNSCHHVVFLIKKSELGDSATDYVLVNTCKEMTYKFCANTDALNLLDCLKTYKDDPAFDQRCHLVVVNRMIEQNTDYRFNPTLQLACGKNIDRYCSKIIAAANPNEELNGKVVQCLKVKFREDRLDPQCQQQMIKILNEQALNYKLNPLLQNFCKSEIEVLCKANDQKALEDHGAIEECLKTAFINQKIINRDCKLEVATLIAETKADIHVDPILEEACTVDLLRYCTNVRSGNGRKLKCLQLILQDQSKEAMEEDCRNKLLRRMEMFKNADTVLAQPPENMEELVTQVVSSPAKQFFILIFFSGLSAVFIIGLVLGRISKKALNTKRK